MTAFGLGLSHHLSVIAEAQKKGGLAAFIEKLCRKHGLRTREYRYEVLKAEAPIEVTLPVAQMELPFHGGILPDRSIPKSNLTRSRGARGAFRERRTLRGLRGSA